MPPGHPYEGEVDGRDERPHTRTLFESPSVRAIVQAWGSVLQDGDPHSESLAIVLANIRVETPGAGEIYIDDLTAAECRDLAGKLQAALVAAAEWLEAQA
jgi:hypothetical protein